MCAASFLRSGNCTHPTKRHGAPSRTAYAAKLLVFKGLFGESTARTTLTLFVTLQNSAQSLHRFSRKMVSLLLVLIPRKHAWYAAFVGWEIPMRRLAAILMLFSLSPLLRSQTTQAPQSARQALIEMFFGSSVDHLEKHLPDATRKTLKRLDSGNGQNALAEISMFSAMAKAGGVNLQTFETGPVLLSVDQPGKAAEHVEITVERDDLMGDEDQLELALHLTKNGKEESLPFTPRFTFAMKSEADVWRLNEISVTVRVPLADPDFLKNIEDRQRTQVEQMAMWSLQSISTSEKTYYAVQNNYACSLSALAKKGPNGQVFLWDAQLASGRKGGYVYAISSCDASHYKVVAEPAAPDSGQRAFCSNEGGTIRAAANGKAATCLSSGEAVEDERTTAITTVQMDTPQAGSGATPQGSARVVPVNPVPSTTAPHPAASGSASAPQRIRVSQGVSQALIVSKIQPQYPADAKAAMIQGQVAMRVHISKTGDVESVDLVSGDPSLAAAAMDAVKQWKYRPYILNGAPVEVETRVTVVFSLAGQ